MPLKPPAFPSDSVEENGNLLQAFVQRSLLFPTKVALRYKILGCYSGAHTWREWMKIVRETAMALYALGVRKGDRVCILSENRPEWTFADLAIMSLGAVTVPIYPTSAAQDIQYILEQTQLKALFVSTDELYQKIRECWESPFSSGVICFSAQSKKDAETMEGFRAKGAQFDLEHPGLYEACVGSVAADDLATIIYTSGTTGAPKGVMLTHRNLIANYQGSWQRIPISEKDSVLSFLPLSHIFERLAGYYYQAAYGVSIAYAENLTTVAEDLRKVRPTIVVAVPRFYEKIYARITEAVKNAPAWKQSLFEWAVRVGRRNAKLKLQDQKSPILLAFSNMIARLLVFNKLKKAMGGRLRFFISGGAPLSKDLALFFYAADILILEGYGLTETSPVIAVNAVGDMRFGSVGKPISGIRVKIAEDGEILTAGPCVMKGYYKNPEATEMCIRDGWFHTGDIGYFDREGFLHITDRKKDIIVTAGGKNVSPQNIESRLLSDTLFTQVMVLGDRRPYLCALIVPNKAEVLRYAHEMSLGECPYAELLGYQMIHDWVRIRIQARMEGLASFETVKAFVLLEREFTTAGGEMTQTQKIKRRVVMKEYQTAIDELYRKTDQEWDRKKTSDKSRYPRQDRL